MQHTDRFHFDHLWREVMARECHRHAVWQSAFVRALTDDTGETRARKKFELAATWSVNMLDGSGWFPNYVMALASRFHVAPHLQLDLVRHGLAENAWDELGAVGHTKRSHFWLAVRLNRLLGLTDHEIERIQPLPEAAAYTREHYQMCLTGDVKLAMGMICLIEEFTTPEFTLIRDTFRRTVEATTGIPASSFERDGGDAYFTANIEDDERHRQQMPTLVAHWLAEEGVDMRDKGAVKHELERFVEGVQKSILLRQQFFDGIFRFVEGGGTHRDLIR